MEDLDVRGQAHGLVGGKEGPAGEVGGGALSDRRMAGGAGPAEGRGLVLHGRVAEDAGELDGGVEVGRGEDLHEARVGEEVLADSP